ncbi:phospholipase, patatin family protein, partial [Aureobasidium melanogenum]
MGQRQVNHHGGDPNPLDTNGLCLLSLDGGGVRGLSTLYILKNIMDRLNSRRRNGNLQQVKPCEVFDLIGGTSTGGIIAIMLGRLEMDVDECIVAYSRLAESVFGQKLSRIPFNLRGNIQARFDSVQLEGAINSVISQCGASEKDLLDDGTSRGCRTDRFVCSVDHYTKGIVRLRSYDLPNEPSVRPTICQAALATSAATTFFNPVVIGDRLFADGGLGANNPVDEVEGEAANVWCPDTGDLKPLVKCFVSIGTGNPGKKAFEDSLFGFLKNTVVEIATETERTDKNFIARWVKHFDDKRYFRFNVEQGLQEVGLEEYKKKGVIEAVTHEYLTHTAQKLQVEKCIQNLSLKQKSDAEAPSKATASDDQELIDQLPFAEQAPFDSQTKQDDPLCLKDTRTEVLKEMRAWAYGEDESCIFWLNGAAGTGKSTIARTFARDCNERRELGASFFFSRGEGDAAHAGKFLTSIVRQLTIRWPALKRHIGDALHEQPNIDKKTRQDQWNMLIARPLQKMGAQQDVQAIIVIVIDALDECDSDQDMMGLIKVLSQAKNIANVRLRIIITSRPETSIRLGFRKMPSILHRDLLLHDIPRDIVDGDICLFFYSQFEDIKLAQDWLDDPCWPDIDLVNRLVYMSEGLFIFAATVCRFVASEPQAEDALKALTDYSSATSLTLPEEEQSEHGNTLHLDQMYTQILQRSLEKRKRIHTAAMQKILGAIAALTEPLCPKTLACLLQIRESDVRAHLDQLHSVLAEASSTYALAFLRRYLLNWWEAMSLIGKLSESLRMLGDLQHSVKHQGRLDQLGKFAASRNDEFGLTSFGQKAETMQANEPAAELLELIHDAHRLLMYHKSGLEAFPLQAYSSALLFSPLRSHVRRLYAREAPRWIIKPASQDWGACLQTLEGHAGPVSSVVFSYDSALVASVPEDSTVKIWEINSGSCVHTLEGHDGCIWSVVFSHDSALIASASEDGTVKIWETSSGSCVHTLKGHDRDVLSVVFSHDSALIASASDDSTVKIWETSSGGCVQTLEGHVEPVSSVVFSYNSALIASASEDGTVKIWQGSSGSCVQTPKGHDEVVSLVVFSHDSALVASASEDSTVKIWETSSGSCVHTLKGHDRYVWSVVFSHDSALIASASDDGTVKIWEINSGSCVHTLKGHDRYVWSVMFSYDSALVASASGDGTVKIWETSSGSCVHTLKDHDRVRRQHCQEMADK